jgi:drug/metabolite transporter (DMT)-like permease
MVLVLWFKGQSIDVFEWMGIAVGIFGVGVSSINPILEEINSPKQDNAGLYALLGDFLCFLAAGCEVAGVLNRLVIRKHVPLFQWIASTTTIVFLISVATAYIFEGVKTFSYTEGGILTLCTDNDCLHGWASSFWVGKFMIFSFAVGVIGWSGFTFACLMVPPLVFSAFGLLEPFAVGLVAWTVGLEGVPSAPTIVGGLIIMAGVVFINIGEIRKEYFHRNESSHEKTSALGDGGDALQTLTNGLCGQCGKTHTLMCGIPLSDIKNEDFTNNIELFSPMLPTTDFSEFAPFGPVSRRQSMLPEGMGQWMYSEVPDTINEDVIIETAESAESGFEMELTSAMKDNGVEGGSGYQTTA